HGARYLSLPEYSLDLLSHPSLRIDFRRSAAKAKKAADLFTAGRHVRVVSDKGTDIALEIDGRTGNFCPGYVDEQCRLGSPPDIEANVSPIEEASNGVAVIDGSIPYPTLGPLPSPLTLRIKQGSIVDMDGPR